MIALIAIKSHYQDLKLVRIMRLDVPYSHTKKR